MKDLKDIIESQNFLVNKKLKNRQKKKMGSMFYKCKKFNSDLSKWNVSNVKWMTGMFTQCTKLYENNNVPAWYTKHL